MLYNVHFKNIIRYYFTVIVTASVVIVLFIVCIAGLPKTSFLSVDCEQKIKALMKQEGYKASGDLKLVEQKLSDAVSDRIQGIYSP